MDGTRKKNTITWPCIENILLYVSASNRSPAGVSNSSRINKAKKPPTKNIAVMETK